MAGQSELATTTTTTVFACTVVQAARGFLVAMATVEFCCKLKSEPLKLGTKHWSSTYTKATGEGEEKNYLCDTVFSQK